MNARFFAPTLAVILMCSVIPRAGQAEESLLTLDEAVKRALAKNPTVTAAQATLEASDNRVYEARSGFLPQAILSASYKRGTLNQEASPALKASPTASQFKSALNIKSMDSFDTYAFSLVVNQLIWDFGRTGGTYDAAKALRDASSFDLESSKRSLWLAVTQAYFTVLATQELVIAASETKKQMEKHLEQAKAQYEVGIRQRIDVTRATSDLASAQLTLVRTTNANRLARVALNNTMGVPEHTDYRVERPANSMPLEVASLEETIREAISNRPETRSLKQKVQALSEQIRVAQSGWYPAIAANAGWNYTGYHLNNLPYNWGVGLTIGWNIFSGLQTVHAVREAEANQRAQQALLSNLEIGIRAEVESALLSYNEARESLIPAKALLDSAQETMYLADGRYNAGTGNIVEVTDAQAVLTQAKAGLIQAEYDIEIARVVLLKATGAIPDIKGE
jgi:outer membrane protein